MTSNQSQSNVNSGSANSMHFWVAVLLALLLLVMWLLGYGPCGAKCKPAPAVIAEAVPAVVAPPALSSAPLSADVQAPALAAAAVPAAKVYFRYNQSSLPKDVNHTLVEVVSYLKANADTKVSLTGFHDPSGSQAHNSVLALNRSRAVRRALEKRGVPDDRILIEKSMESTGNGRLAEARRVEISVVKP